MDGFDGFLNLLKPPGMTSSDAVIMVRKMLPKGTRVGHGGTLDPDAAGVLPICVGKATRLFDYIIDKKKQYIAELCLGIETDTQDSTGKIIREMPVHADEQDIKNILPQFIGQIQQIPPAYSAIKKGGVRAYDMARKGQEVQLEPRSVFVHNLTYICPSGENRHMILVECGKGLYVRTLMHDIGHFLGCCGHMSFLLRNRAGYFDVKDAVTLNELREGQIENLLVPMDAPIDYLQRVDVSEEYIDYVKCGNAVQPGWIASEQNLEPGQITRIYCSGRFAGIGQYRDDGKIEFKAMLLG